MPTRFADHLPTGDHASRPAANAVPVGTLYSCTDHAKIYQSDGSTWSDWASFAAGSLVTSVLGQTGAVTFAVSVPFVIDGGGAEITTGYKGEVEVPFDGTITVNRLSADQPGDIVIDVWKAAFANLPLDSGDSITASAKPTLSSAQTSEDATLTGWTTSVSAGEWIGFNVDLATDIERVTISLTITRIS